MSSPTVDIFLCLTPRSSVSHARRQSPYQPGIVLQPPCVGRVFSKDTPPLFMHRSIRRIVVGWVPPDDEVFHQPGYRGVHLSCPRPRALWRPRSLPLPRPRLRPLPRHRSCSFPRRRFCMLLWPRPRSLLYRCWRWYWLCEVRRYQRFSLRLVHNIDDHRTVASSSPSRADPPPRSPCLPLETIASGS